VQVTEGKSEDVVRILLWEPQQQFLDLHLLRSEVGADGFFSENQQ
jgi:hypothetical protein